MSKNIVIIGYRGVGKSVVAKILSKRLKMDVINTDEEIIKKTGPIPEYIETKGWEGFRDIEEKVIERFNVENSIIDCGGGVIERPKNIENLKKNGIVIWLKADVEELKNRLKSDYERPSLTGKPAVEEIEEVLKKRNPIYHNSSDYEVDTDNKTVEQVTEEIIKIMETYER